MSEFARGLICMVGFLLVLGTPLRAQENLDRGKTPAQLYASDCATCHKSPQGLAAKGGLFGLENFLREHYTASRESAAAIASYLRAVGGPPAPAGRSAKRPPKGDKKPGEKKPEAAKPEAAKPGDAKPADSKASETNPAEPKAEPKPTEAKPAEAKSAEPKAAEPKAAEPKPAEGGKSD